jgi:diguanylate cyclase (GGDEF)-like protein
MLFTDLSMPDGNGLELIAAVHAESPQTPIIVISGAGMVVDAVAAMKEGACDYLCKPIRDMAALEHLTRQAIERFRQQRCSKATGEDPLTGLPDSTQMDHLFQHVGTSGSGITLALVDLDSFKAIKDAFGHAVGDRLLMEVGERLSLHAGRQDALIHLGGDEFALLLATPDQGSVDLRIAAVREAVAEPFRIGQDELIVTASIGIALFPHDGSSSDELLKHASTALYEAKKTGKNCVRRYCSSIRTNSERFSLQAKLRRAHELREFSLVFQPQYDMVNGSLHGVEALVRWQPLVGHLVTPALFIPALEESGLIVPVGEWILREACTHYRQWQSLGAPHCMLSVNVSAVQFHASGFVAMVRRVLQETDMPPTWLCLELTESVVMRDGEETIATLSALKDLGVALSLDDFGTGYSSLSYLSRMPLDELKIDRSFVSSLPHSANNASIVDTIIGLAACMNLRVVAEGIEHSEQAAFLREKKCQIAQGYYFSHPLPPSGVIDAFGREYASLAPFHSQFADNRDPFPAATARHSC